MPSSLGSGTQTAVVSTEHTLHTETGNKTCVLVVDLANLANGDTVELRIYTKAKSGGTERLAYMRSYQNAQSELVVYSIPVPADVSFKATLKQTAGTGRNFDWSVLGI